METTSRTKAINFTKTTFALFCIFVFCQGCEVQEQKVLQVNEPLTMADFEFSQANGAHLTDQHTPKSHQQIKSYQPHRLLDQQLATAMYEHYEPEQSKLTPLPIEDPSGDLFNVDNLKPLSRETSIQFNLKPVRKKKPQTKQP